MSHRLDKRVDNLADTLINQAAELARLEGRLVALSGQVDRLTPDEDAPRPERAPGTHVYAGRRPDLVEVRINIEGPPEKARRLLTEEYERIMADLEAKMSGES